MVVENLRESTRPGKKRAVAFKFRRVAELSRAAFNSRIIRRSRGRRKIVGPDIPIGFLAIVPG